MIGGAQKKCIFPLKRIELVDRCYLNKVSVFPNGMGIRVPKLAIYLVLLLATAGCGDPFSKLEKLSDVEVSSEAPQADLVSSTEVPLSAESVPSIAALPDETTKDDPPRRGILGFLRRSADNATSQSDAEAPTEDAAQPEDDASIAKAESAEQSEGQNAEVASLPVKQNDAETASEETPKRGGLFGALFSRSKSKAETPQETAALPAVLKEKDEEETLPDPVALAVVVPQEDVKKKRSGLFGGALKRSAPAKVKPGAPDYQQVGPGVTLPFGQLARLCGVSAAKLGKKVSKYPERGRGYTLYDSKPGSTTPRNFFITGFDDGCSRQFTASLALFGPPQMHELLRYGLPAKVQPYSETDAAYETLKRKLCGVSKGKPCGSKISKLGKTTVFVSVYEKFGSNQRWKNLLLHDGTVVASDIKHK